MPALALAPAPAGVAALDLDDAQLYRALASRDARFDGVFFVGVTSTRVYCRPICRAPKPRPDRCRYYPSTAAAERSGFRPCLRCRPELAPARTASVDAVARLARDAAARIAAGALDRGGLDALAAELGVSARHLRRALERELGATPVELAQSRRLLTAKQLLTETRLPVTEIAYASGFGSLRRFNALFRTRYRLAPSALRRRTPAVDEAAGATVTLSLAYRPPLAWESLVAYLAARAAPGLEAASAAAGGDGRYVRTIRLHGHHGHVAVGRAPEAEALRVEVSTSLLPVLVPLMARLRRLFDLDAEPDAVAAHLAADPALRAHLRRRPGLRVPGTVDGFELALRAVLGQQVSVRGATTLFGRLVALVGEPLAPAPGERDAPAGLTHLPIAPERLAEASVAAVMSIGLTTKRAECVVALARAVAAGELPELTGDARAARPLEFVQRFIALPGIGRWTAEYVAMRALGWPDAFPDGDLVLRKAMGGLPPARLRAAAERWRPWRAYAAHHLWAAAAAAAR